MKNGLLSHFINRYILPQYGTIILFRSKKVMKQHKELNRFIFSKH